MPTEEDSPELPDQECVVCGKGIPHHRACICIPDHDNMEMKYAHVYCEDGIEEALDPPEPEEPEGPLDCPECGRNMGERVDTTYSNVNTPRADKGEHTGDIFRCDSCEIRWIDDFLENTLRQW